MILKPRIFCASSFYLAKTATSIFLSSFLLISFISLLNIGIAQAAPRYNPGQTLDPDCLPTDPDCTVTTIFSSITSGTATVGSIAATSTTATSTFAGGVSMGGDTGLTVLANGMVGIGTSSPSAPLFLPVKIPTAPIGQIATGAKPW